MNLYYFRNNICLLKMKPYQIFILIVKYIFVYPFYCGEFLAFHGSNLVLYTSLYHDIKIENYNISMNYQHFHELSTNIYIVNLWTCNHFIW